MKRFTIFVLLSVTAAALRAQSVTQTEAMQRASRYYNEHVRPAGLRSTAEAEPAAVTPWMAGDTTCMYAVQMDGGGWVLVSADDRTTASVLAYSENGIFDTGDMPDGMRWLMDMYASQIQEVKNSTDSVPTPTQGGFRKQKTENISGSDIYSPGNYLLKIDGQEILWGQSTNNENTCLNSYNALCPECDGKNCDCGRCDAGCGPVALAMVMRYWQWPPSAAIPTTPGGDEKVARFYDWEKMPYQIDSKTPNESALAIAGLLRDCGYTAESSYKKNYTLTWRREMVDALEAFYYHTNNWEVRLGTDWDDRIRNEINQGRPVLYNGGPHWFVIDGYQHDPDLIDYFHLNIGWNGLYNAYYTLSHIVTEDNDNFTAAQVAIMGVYPDCNKYIINGSILHLTESGIVKSVPNRPIHTKLQVSLNNRVEYIVPSIELLPGTEIELGSSLDIQIAPAYQFCNTRGPGNIKEK